MTTTKKRKASNVTKRSKDATASSDWLNALVKQTSSEDPENNVSSKQERIDKRLAKKQRQQERRQATTAIHNTSTSAITEPAKTNSNKTKASKTQSFDSDPTRKGLVRVAGKVHSAIVKSSEPQHAPSSTNMSRRPRLYQPDTSATTTNFKKRQWEVSSIQPRRNDYGGIGLARDSLYLELSDPSFGAKLQQEFAEHVSGFFGKQRTKAMKKQLNSNMLWKQMATKKDLRIDGKRLGDMKPDDQVEALIKAGVIM
ncbi:hypothetical protein MPSEU_000747700 [Mayamaea pseudoterrestris]|nr:hypothetical protein MPSEU_000747700 [Mayamaea pseudoterrestris]